MRNAWRNSRLLRVFVLLSLVGPFSIFFAAWMDKSHVSNAVRDYITVLVATGLIFWYANKKKMKQDGIKSANFLYRMAAFGIDYFISTNLFTLLSTFIIRYIIALLVKPMANVVWLVSLHFMLEIACYTLYYALFLISPFRATLGQLFMNMSVVSTAQSKKTSLNQALLRGCIKGIEQLFPFMIPLWLAIFTKKHMALHDMIARTEVVEPMYKPL